MNFIFGGGGLHRAGSRESSVLDEQRATAGAELSAALLELPQLELGDVDLGLAVSSTPFGGRLLHQLLLLLFEQLHLGLACGELLLDEGELLGSLVVVSQLDRILSLGFGVENRASLRRVVGVDEGALAHRRRDLPHLLLFELVDF